MTTPAEFWGSIMASGLTAEQELVELWQRLRDCVKTPRIVGGGGGGLHHRIPVPDALRIQQLDEDDLIIAFMTSILQAGLLNR